MLAMVTVGEQKGSVTTGPVCSLMFSRSRFPSREQRKMDGKIFEDFLQKKSPFRSLFSRGREKSDVDEESSRCVIPELSVSANSVVARCSRIVGLSANELQQKFEDDVPEHLKHPSTYARNLLEYCSYQALHVCVNNPNYLADKEFRKLTYDMMLAWEDPGVGGSGLKENVPGDSADTEDDDDGSLFYANSTSMAVKVDNNVTVGVEAFSRIASACAAVADPITVHNLFDVLTSSSSGQLHFLIYDKYLGSLDKVCRSVRNLLVPSLVSGLQLSEDEVLLDVDGTIPTQPVFQHVGISAWPGRLVLTNNALYFQSLGVGSYDKAVAYDLAMDLKQVIKPDLTGPLGARIFDKAVMYKTSTLVEPIYFEFPEFKGHSRRDYWLAIILEVIYVNRFIRKYDLKGTKKAEALSKAILSILRYRAVREAFHITPSHFKTLLSFSLAEELPKGDEILDALHDHLENLATSEKSNNKISSSEKLQRGYLPVSLKTLTKLGFSLLKDTNVILERGFLISDVFFGDSNPLEMAVKQSLCHTGLADAARATVDEVKVEGIDTNVAVIKELLFPVLELHKRIGYLASWKDPLKSAVFFMLVVYVICKDWITYLLSCTLIILAMLMLWQKYRNKGVPLEAVRINLPPSRNPVEQLITLQEAISQFQALIQAGNIILLKIRAIFLAALPQATDTVAFFLIAAAIAVAVVPFKIFVMLAFIECFTREMPLRKNVSEKFDRRLREWWIHIPAAPVQLIGVEESKKKK